MENAIYVFISIGVIAIFYNGLPSFTDLHQDGAMFSVLDDMGMTCMQAVAFLYITLISKDLFLPSKPPEDNKIDRDTPLNDGKGYTEHENER